MSTIGFHRFGQGDSPTSDRRGRGGLWLAALLSLLSLTGAVAAEVIPSVPARHFNDYAGVVPADVENRLNTQLEEFERQTSSHIVVAVFQKMQSNSSIEDYTVRVAEAWGVGDKDKDNGAVLFVFIQDRSLFLQVGYGFEGALPDATAHQIIESEIKPHFRRGDYAAGLTAGVDTILKAVRGEYKGTGRTLAERRGQSGAINPVPLLFILALIVFMLFLLSRAGRGRSRVYRRGGYSGWGGGWGGGGFGGGRGGGFGGGGFSGGGGSFGGGGAGGRW